MIFSSKNAPPQYLDRKRRKISVFFVLKIGVWRKKNNETRVLRENNIFFMKKFKSFE
jgi:hypothetical protein